MFGIQCLQNIPIHDFSVIAIFQAKEFGLKMKSILPAKDGEFVAKFESWRIPRNKGDGNEQWSSLGSNSKTQKTVLF